LFNDKALEESVRRGIDKPNGELTISDLKKITKLIASGKGISNLKGIDYCTNLRSLDLSNNNIEDIAYLSRLDKLNLLDLSYNQIKDISPIENKKSIETLYLNNNSISDISTLKTLNDITHLYLSKNRISNISPLNYMENLQLLYLNNNNISDIEPLSELTNIILLNLSSNKISDIYPLSNLRQLTQLNLSNNNIKDISPLYRLDKLIYLNLSSNQIESTSSLANLNRLRVLLLDHTSIWDVTILKNIYNNGGFHKKISSEEYDITIIDNYLDMRPGSPDRNTVETLIRNGVRVRWEKGNFTTNEYTGEPIKINQIIRQKNNSSNLINNLDAQGGDRLVNLNWRFNSLKITWEEFPKANYYKIYRHTNDGKKKYLGSSYGNEFVDNNPMDSDNYYSVSVMNVLGEIAESEPIKAPSPNEGYSFVVQRSKTEHGTFDDIGTTIATNYSDKGLSYDETYYYRIKAVKEDTTEPNLSNMVNARTFPLNIDTLDISSSPYKVEYNNIFLLVNVFNEDYLPLKWLDENNFNVSEDGTSLKIRSVSPVENIYESNVIMMDYSKTMSNSNKEYMTEQTKMMINRKNKNDEYKIIKFSNSVNNSYPFEPDYMKLEDTLSKSFNDTSGKNNLYDALYRGVAEVSKKYYRNRRYLTLFSNGIDTDSTHRLDEVILYAQLNYIPIYTIANDGSDKDVLNTLADETGGIMFDCSDIDNLSNKMSYMFKKTYLLEVQVPQIKDKHTLTVECDYNEHSASTETVVYIKDRDLLPEFPVHILKLDKTFTGEEKPVELQAEGGRNEIKLNWKLNPSVRITWQDLPNVSYYKIYHSSTPDGEYIPIDTSRLPKYVHKNVTQGTHYYKVSIVNKFGEFAESEPQSYQAESVIEKSLTFDVFVSESPNKTFSIINSEPVTEYTFTDKGLPANKTYYYKVRISTTEPNQPLSQPANATTLPPIRKGLEITRPVIRKPNEDGIIKLFLVVYNENGEVITDLSEDEIEIREDGEQLEIVSFRIDDEEIPLSGVLTMDYSGSMYESNPYKTGEDDKFLWDDSPNINLMEQQIKYFASNKSSVDELGIIRFSKELEFFSFSTDSEELSNYIETVFSGRGDVTSLYQTLYEAVEEVSMKDPSKRRFVVGFTDGENYTESEEADQYTKEMVIELAEKNNIPIFTIAYGDVGTDGTDILKGIARKTGGTMTQANQDVSGLYRMISEQIKRTYIIEVAVPVVKDIHNLEVTCDGVSGVLETEVYTD